MFNHLRVLLLSNDDLAGSITGVYHGSVPISKPLPALSAFLVSETIRDAIDDSPAALTQQNWQVNVVASSGLEASTIADLTVTAIHKQSVTGVDYALVTSRRDDPPIAGGSVHRVIIEIILTPRFL